MSVRLQCPRLLLQAHRTPLPSRSVYSWSSRTTTVGTSCAVRLSSFATTRCRNDASLKLAVPRPEYQRRLQSTSKGHNGLRILFCGADAFSIYSLKALHARHTTQPSTIASIDVVCRPDKRVGSGLKQIREVPIKSTALELGLPLHQIDTFTGWSPPHSIDLIVTVSFGLLVPARLLKAATYGGVNVHPSMLPDLRGPAPIHHALLEGREYTGVSLQTMHPTTFDAGVVLAQTPSPGMPIAEHATISEMIETLGQAGADMLVRGIEDGLHVSPQQSFSQIDATGSALHHAPKITPEDRHIDWATWTSKIILRRDRVLGRLWDNVTVPRLHAAAGGDDKNSPATRARRITFTGPWTHIPLDKDYRKALTPGQPLLLNIADTRATDEPTVVVCCADGQVMAPHSATIEGRKAHQGLPTLRKLLKVVYEKSHPVTEVS